MFDDSDLVDAYTRTNALEDGVLIDVTDTAKEAGFVYPVALTREVYCKYVQVPNGVNCQDEQGRLWDILTMLRWAIKAVKGEKGPVKHFRLSVMRDDGRNQAIELKSVCGPGDDWEPVITIMLPDQD